MESGFFHGAIPIREPFHALRAITHNGEGLPSVLQGEFACVSLGRFLFSSLPRKEIGKLLFFSTNTTILQPFQKDR